MRVTWEKELNWGPACWTREVWCRLRTAPAGSGSFHPGCDTSATPRTAATRLLCLWNSSLNLGWFYKLGLIEYGINEIAQALTLGLENVCSFSAFPIALGTSTMKGITESTREAQSTPLSHVMTASYGESQLKWAMRPSRGTDITYLQ